MGSSRHAPEPSGSLPGLSQLALRKFSARMTARGSFVTTRSRTASGPDGWRTPCSYCCTSSKERPKSCANFRWPIPKRLRSALTSSGEGGGYTASAPTTSASDQASPSSAACAWISCSLGDRRAASSLNNLGLSISARVRRTIGIALLSAGIAQADDPANTTAHGVDAMQYHLLDLADRSKAYLAIGLAVVNPLDEWSFKREHC